MTKRTQSYPFDDAQAWLAVAAALVSVGVLPQGWQKSIALASSLAWLASRFE